MNLFINSRLSLLVAPIVLVVLLAGGPFQTLSAAQKTKSISESQSSKNDISNFKLTNHLGSKASLSDYKGKIVILLFGYTHCPDICPTQLNDMQKVLDKLGDDADQIQVVFITFDPERDTPKVLKDYLAFFNPGFVGLTGTKEEIVTVAQQFNVIFMKREVKSEAGYLMGHSSVIYVLDPLSKMYNWYMQNIQNPSSTVDEMAEDIQELLKEYREFNKNLNKSAL